MRILLFGLNGRGGMLHYTSQYANALQKAGHDVIVVLPTYSRTDLFSKNIRLVRIPAPTNIGKTILQTCNVFFHTRLAKKLFIMKPDVVHFMDIHPWYKYYGKKLSYYPVFSTIHDPKLHSGEDKGLQAKVVSSVKKYLFEISQGVFIHNEADKKELTKSKKQQETITVIPHGEYSFATKWKINTKSNPQQFLFFGRIVEYKGLDILLKAFSQVLKKHPESKLVIAGEGNMSAYQTLLTPEVKRNTHIINRFISEKEMGKLFTEAGSVVLPYKDATQSGIVPIAYAFSKPVIATAVGGLPQVVLQGKTGLLVPENNVEKLAEAMSIMLEAPQKTWGEAGHTFMQKELSWENIVQTTTAAYPKMPSLSVINKATHDKVFSIINKKKKSKLLDLGAGNGNFSQRAKDAGHEVYACDIFPEAFVPKGIPIDTSNINEKLSYKDNTFDQVVAIEVIEHLENPWHMIRECHRILKPGGTLIITTPNVNSVFSRLLYLFKGRFAHFGLDLNYVNPKKPYYDDFHKTPVFTFLFKEAIYQKFRLKQIHVNRSVIPFLNIKLPFKTEKWGESIIYEVIKK